MEKVIELASVSKVFKLYESNSARFKEALLPFGKKYHTNFYALKDINLCIRKGECVAIIGQNGSGKSTLLKIITSIITPSEGDLKVKGRISSLLELGTGFNPDLTGRENIYFFGTINGFTRVQMEEKIKDIIDFADIGSYIDQAVRSYSSGMFVRLAFACAIQIDPEILIVDEALAVGDLRFVQKCFRKMQSFKDQEKTLILVTHDMPSVIAFASRTIWIEGGRVVADGLPDKVVREYVSKMTYGQKSNSENILLNGQGEIDINRCESFGLRGAEFSSVSVSFSNRKFDGITKGNEMLLLHFTVTSQEPLEEPGIGVLIKDEKGYPVTGVNNYVYGKRIPSIGKSSTLNVEYSIRLPNLRVGRYSVSVALSDGNQEDHVQHHFIHDIFDLHFLAESDRFRLGHLVVLEEKDFLMKVVD